MCAIIVVFGENFPFLSSMLIRGTFFSVIISQSNFIFNYYFPFANFCFLKNQTCHSIKRETTFTIWVLIHFFHIFFSPLICPWLKWNENFFNIMGRYWDECTLLYYCFSIHTPSVSINLFTVHKIQKYQICR